MRDFFDFENALASPSEKRTYFNMLHGKHAARKKTCRKMAQAVTDHILTEIFHTKSGDPLYSEFENNIANRMSISLFENSPLPTQPWRHIADDIISGSLTDGGTPTQRIITFTKTLCAAEYLHNLAQCKMISEIQNYIANTDYPRIFTQHLSPENIEKSQQYYADIINVNMFLIVAADYALFQHTENHLLTPALLPIMEKGQVIRPAKQLLRMIAKKSPGHGHGFARLARHINPIHPDHVERQLHRWSNSVRVKSNISFFEKIYAPIDVDCLDTWLHTASPTFPAVPKAAFIMSRSIELLMDFLFRNISAQYPDIPPSTIDNGIVQLFAEFKPSIKEIHTWLKKEEARHTPGPVSS